MHTVLRKRPSGPPRPQTGKEAIRPGVRIEKAIAEVGSFCDLTYMEGVVSVCFSDGEHALVKYKKGERPSLWASDSPEVNERIRSSVLMPEVRPQVREPAVYVFVMEKGTKKRFLLKLYYGIGKEEGSSAFSPDTVTPL